MKTRWSESFNICSIEEDFDSWPATAGVYIIRGPRSVPRIGGTDKTGILYFGKATKLCYRIWAFKKANHTASGFLWAHTDIAQLVLNRSIRTQNEVLNYLMKLTVRFATPLDSRQLSRAERALMFSYISQFGEAPPLNLSLVSRWESKPSATDLSWAEEGIQRRT